MPAPESGTNGLPQRRWLAFALASAILAALVGCGPAKPPAVGSVKVVGLSPDITTPLKVGETVKVQVELSYRLSADSGSVGVVVQDGNRNLAQSMRAVRKGPGNATLSVEFVVPETKAIQLFIPLQAQGQTATATVALRTYKVLAK